MNPASRARIAKRIRIAAQVFCYGLSVIGIGILAALLPSVPSVLLAAGSPPAVDAGPDKSLAFPAKDLTLFGHAADPENDALVVHWTVLSGPGAVTFSNADALTTTATFSATGTYSLQLSANDGLSTVTDTAVVTVNPASSQTAFYVDPTYTGTIQNGSASAPWKDFTDGNPDYTAQWNAINAALAANDVIVYFSARKAGSDASEEVSASVHPTRTDKSTHRLTLDGMSKYNTNDATPNWFDYTGSNRFRINMTSSYGCCFSIGWYSLADGDGKFDYVTMRGFEVTGKGARITWGGSYSVLEYIWSHDVTSLGATVQFDSAVTDYPACVDQGKSHDITVRNNLIERGIGEGLYIAGTYSYTSYGGCPSYGNMHSDILIENNTIREPGINGDQGDAVDLKAGLLNVTVRNNVVQNTHPNMLPDDEADGITSEGAFGSAKTNYLIEGNRISGTWHGMIFGAHNGIVVRNNVLSNIRYAGIYFSGDAPAGFTNKNIEIYNNTVYASAGGIGLGDTSQIKIRNNLLFGTTTGNVNIGGWNVTGLDSDYNVMSPTGSDCTEGTHSILQSGASGIVANAAGGDFHLVSASPAKDKGVNLDSTGFSLDFDKVTRPQGVAWDVGAYEYASGGTPAPTLILSAAPTSMTSGQSSTLAWSSTNTTTCTASGGWNGSKEVSGSQSVSPTGMTPMP